MSIKEQLTDMRNRSIRIEQFKQFDLFEFDAETEQFELNVDFFNTLATDRLSASEMSLMRRVYVNGDSIVGAAGEMNISTAYAYNLHSSAMRKLNAAFNRL